MKKIAALLLLFTFLFSTLAFANESKEITFKELTEIVQKYGIELEIIENSEVYPENVIVNLTKEEIESLIIQMRSEISVPMILKEDLQINVNEENFLEDKDSNFVISLRSANWSTVNGVKSLSRISEHLSPDFRLRKNVAVSYQYEHRRFPGEPSETRNWKFTGVSDGGVVHLNDGVYRIKSISSNAKLLSSTRVEQNYNGVVNVGFYTTVQDITVRIPLGDKNFEGTVIYNISEVQ